MSDVESGNKVIVIFWWEFLYKGVFVNQLLTMFDNGVILSID